ncbi:MAG: M20/M25/M40 family metallo-hydrolase [Alphaproteobacteria bacterium]|nr:M20/M25/M40 family metallo-hydrolase [Alphaproteobacteria bacterium]
MTKISRPVAAAFLVLSLCLAATSRPAVADALISVERLRQQAETATPEAVAFLSKSLRYKSVEDFGYELKPDTKALLEFIFAEATKLGFDTRLAAGGLAGVLEYGSGKETVGVLIHVDVVPASQSGKWTHPPFAGVVADGYVWGRGAQDDKGALAATLWGTKLLIDNGLPFKRKLRIILGTKEEKSFEGLTRYFQEEKQPDFGLVPDGVYFIEGEKGIADMTISFPGLKPTRRKRDTVIHWRGGTVVNSVPDFSYMIFASTDVAAARDELTRAVEEATAALKAGKSDRFYGVTAPYQADLSVMDYAAFIEKYGPKDAPKDGDLVLVSRGKAIHGSAPWAGRNAIIEVALAASLLENLSDSAYVRAIDFVTKRIGLNPYGQGIVNASGKGIPFDPPEGLRKPPLGLTALQYYGSSINLGLVGGDPNKDILVLTVDFRTGLGNSNGQLLKHTQASARLHGGEAAYAPGVGSHYDPVYHSGEHPVMKMAVQSYRDVNPKYPSTIPYRFFSPGTTYLKLVDNFVNFGPVDIYPDPSVNKFHQDDERISIKSLTTNIVLFAHALQMLLQAEPSPAQPR